MESSLLLLPSYHFGLMSDATLKAEKSNNHPLPLPLHPFHPKKRYSLGNYGFKTKLFTACAVNQLCLYKCQEFVVQMDNKVQNESNIGRNEQFCTLCEEYTSQVINYLGGNETQAHIISTLHKACSRMHFLKQQCISLVDHYAPLFFLELSTITPEQLCEKANLCGDTELVNLPKSSDFCTLCHNIVKEILTKLEDPDTQLEVIKMLMKGCEEVGSYVRQCKKLVLQYVPPILINAEKFLETTDVCTAIYACKNSEDHITSTVADM
ncbi:hypothetical protein C4D60_Mb08t21690 [Musa balbisiana]|uniref:Pulmonary surfactant-associated protein B n=1 Tax=Musa balbisiana TaxID=52838 RepID=A0A4S8K5H9_MUSBA|nr:hypothetical protein C4D60_Mb08t21690 [Musa balbisiana]